MYTTAMAGEKAGLTAPGTANILKNLLESYNLPYELPPGADIRKISEAVKHDKKRRGDTLNLVLLESIGKGFLHQIHKSEYADFIDYK
jgi:3-dehydroquinate synthase